MNLTRAIIAGAALALLGIASTAAQDIRGLEICTAEKQMDRRTGCLQANVEFLQQALAKQARESNGKLDAANRESAAAKTELATAKADIAALKDAVAKLQSELAQLKSKAEPPAKNEPPAKK